MTEQEALEKSVSLWIILIEHLSNMSAKEIKAMDEQGLIKLKEHIDQNTKNARWHCYLCHYHIGRTCFVKCADCCIAKACGMCNGFYNNEFSNLVRRGNPRITKLRAANRMLRAMKKRLEVLKTT